MAAMAAQSTDYRSMFDSDYLGAWDLVGRDVTVVIDRVEAGELTGQGGRKARKPIVYFRGAKKGLALNKTNAKAIAGMYGTDTRQWVGKAITIYPTKTTFGSEQVDCIRVRNTIPRAKGRGQQQEAEPEQPPQDQAEPEQPAESEPSQDREPGQD